jgi:heme/copper-type cytochrome/quinol oxidase subunit 3
LKWIVVKIKQLVFLNYFYSSTGFSSKHLGVALYAVSFVTRKAAQKDAAAIPHAKKITKTVKI